MPSYLKSLLVVAGLSLTAPSFAESYTLVVYETPKEIAKRKYTGAAGKAYWDGYNRFAQTLIEAGALRGGTALKPNEPATAQSLSGYFIIEAPSLTAAKDLAKRASSGVAATVEVFETYPNPVMTK